MKTNNIVIMQSLPEYVAYLVNTNIRNKKYIIGFLLSENLSTDADINEFTMQFLQEYFSPEKMKAKIIEDALRFINEATIHTNPVGSQNFIWKDFDIDLLTFALTGDYNYQHIMNVNFLYADFHHKKKQLDNRYLPSERKDNLFKAFLRECLNYDKFEVAIIDYIKELNFIIKSSNMSLNDSKFDSNIKAYIDELYQQGNIGEIFRNLIKNHKTTNGYSIS